MNTVFCRGCGKGIQVSASACPHCGAPQLVKTVSDNSETYTSYNDVPWHRKNWFAIVCALLFTPALLFVLFTGDVYYQRKGQLKTYPKGVKIFLIVWSVVIILSAVARA